MKSELKEIKKLNILSVAKVALILGVIIGIIQGIIMGFSVQQMIANYPDLANMSFSDDSVAGNSQMILSLVLIKLGWWNIVVMPIFLAIAWWIGALISACIYNFIARKFGGIKLELD
jgi:small basic protein